jgi:hypothetical protein
MTTRKRKWVETRLRDEPGDINEKYCIHNIEIVDGCNREVSVKTAVVKQLLTKQKLLVYHKSFSAEYNVFHDSDQKFYRVRVPRPITTLDEHNHYIARFQVVVVDYQKVLSWLQLHLPDDIAKICYMYSDLDSVYIKKKKKS